MLPEYYIEWISLQTKQGNQRKELHYRRHCRSFLWDAV